ncbi:MAG TPA: hypothetical protein VEB69_12160 [Acidimicrobiia bacterium]|nr:hypothetical protein [Acidimicrobiia bacterium]
MSADHGSTRGSILQDCPACGESFDHDVARCPECGQRTAVGRRRMIVIVTVIVLTIAALAALWAIATIPSSPISPR